MQLEELLLGKHNNQKETTNMNLELLDPFRRQIPDRIDSTLSLPSGLHPQQQHYDIKGGGKGGGGGESSQQGIPGGGGDEDSIGREASVTPSGSTSSPAPPATNIAIDDATNNHNNHEDVDADWKAAYHVSFNRRGTYLAVGHANGIVAVHDFLSRTISALYRPPDAADAASTTISTISATITTNNSLPMAAEPLATAQNSMEPSPLLHLSSSADKMEQRQQQQVSRNNSSNDEPLSSDSPPLSEVVPLTFPNGTTSVTWSRRSRTVLAGAVGDCNVRLFDTTHPLGSAECCAPVIASKEQAASGGGGETSFAEGGPDHPLLDLSPTPVSQQQPMSSKQPTIPSLKQQQQQPLDSADSGDSSHYEMSRMPRRLEMKVMDDLPEEVPVDPAVALVQERHTAALKRMREKEESPPTSNDIVDVTDLDNDNDKSVLLPNKRRYATLFWTLPEPVGGSLQVHPRDPTSGLAVLKSGKVVLFRAPPNAWELVDKEVPKESNNNNQSEPVVKMMTLWDKHEVTCAAFDPYGDKVYMATKNGKLLGVDIKGVLTGHLGDHWGAPNISDNASFEISVPSAAQSWHLVTSRNGKLLLMNCSDGALRMYNTAECWGASSPSDGDDGNVKPSFVFQDVVSKVPFASCDFSGDGEYVVGGCNGVDDKYELYLWNTTTGALMDRLTGAQVSLYSVTWHPTRSFLAVATSDGLVDIWGPRMDWTAFAPDFQALPMNLEYAEREDEFDIVDKNQEDKSSCCSDEPMEENDNIDVDVVTVGPVPVFESDSEEEDEVFYYGTKIKNVMAGRGRSTAFGSGKVVAKDDE